MKTNKGGGPLGGAFNTLAKIGTSQFPDDAIWLAGTGYDISKSSVRYNLIQKKFLTQNLVILMIDIAKEKKNQKLLKSLWNAYHCMETIYVDEYRIHGQRCKTRFCKVCSGIRKADLVNKYKPVLDSWPDTHFLTLTWKSCEIDKLPEHIKNTLEIFNRIKAKLKKQHQRGKGPKIIGIRSLEANYHPEEEKKTYNPHLHILVPTYKIAYILRKEWIEYFNDPKIVNPEAQKIRQVLNTERDLKEVIKYASTVFTDKLKSLKKNKKNKNYGIYVRAMYNLIVAMNGRHLFASFGFNLPENKDSVSQLKQVDSVDEFKYDSKEGDYINEVTGEILLQYKPSYSLLDKLKNDVDTILE